MSEASQVYAVARKYLSAFGRIERIENRLDATTGWPDAHYVLRHQQGWLEFKLIPASGRCPPHMTREQLLWGEEEVRCGGRWHLLARCGPEWWLMDVDAASAWFGGAPAAPLVRVWGRFPTREVLDVIAPLPRPEFTSVGTR